MVQPQLVVKPRGHRDLLVEGCVVVDLDGWATHGNKVAFREDRALDRFAIHDGKVTLRYTYADLFGRDRVDLVADVEAGVRRVLRLDRDLSGFYAAVAGDPDLAWAASGAGRWSRSRR